MTETTAVLLVDGSPGDSGVTTLVEVSKYPSAGLDPTPPPAVVGEQPGVEDHDPAQRGDVDPDDADAHRPGDPFLRSGRRGDR